jgi:hypothetical protein
MRFGHGLAGITETGPVKLNRVAHSGLDLGPGRSSGNAAREIGRVGRQPGRCGLHDDQVALGHFSPACWRTLFSVPGASSSLGFPASVTSPGFSGC